MEQGVVGDEEIDHSVGDPGSVMGTAGRTGVWIVRRCRGEDAPTDCIRLDYAPQPDEVKGFGAGRGRP
jgi:hypothetical protein